MLFHAALPRFPPSTTPVSAYLALKLGITSPRLLQCSRDPSQPSSAAESATLGGTRRTRMKESHEVQEIRQGTSDDCHLCWRRPQHLVLRTKLYSRLSVRHRNEDRLTPRVTASSAALKSITTPANSLRSTGLPISSGGSNPVRAVLLTGGRFVYVLNQGVRQPTVGLAAPPTSAERQYHPVFDRRQRCAVHRRAPTTPRESIPFRLIADSSGTHIFVA